MKSQENRWGGSRQGAGRYKQNLHISQDAARSLRVLTLSARGVRSQPDLTEDQIIEELIEAAWQAYDEQIQAAADEAYEGGVL